MSGTATSISSWMGIENQYVCSSLEDKAKGRDTVLFLVTRKADAIPYEPFRNFLDIELPILAVLSTGLLASYSLPLSEKMSPRIYTIISSIS